MSKKVRKSKNELQLEKDSIDKKVEGSHVEKKSGKRILNFDMYFQLLRRRNPNILIHHKAPMRKFAEEHNLKNGTEDEFDKVFKRY